MRGWLLLLLLSEVLAAGCGSGRHVVRTLEAGSGVAREWRPGPGTRVAVKRLPFQQAVQLLARGVRPPENPAEAARRLFQVAARSGDYLYDAKGKRLTPLEDGERAVEAPTEEQWALTKDYLAWCGRTGRPGDCLKLLLHGPVIDEEGRITLALALAQGVVWEETLAALKGMAEPETLRAAMAWTMATYLLLLALPEPVSKGIAAAMTVALIGYVGLDTFWGLIAGYLQLVDGAREARTFDELRRVGEPYGKVMGVDAARAFAMLALAAVGSTAGQFSSKLPGLPGFAQASAQAQGQVGVSLEAAAELESVVVSEAVVEVGMRAGAMLMAGKSGTAQQEPEADTDCTGEEHHIISRPIAQQLQEHRTLKGLFEPRDPRYVSRAKDADAHKGYQKWHRDVDKEVIKWLMGNPFATPEEFLAVLREIYSRPAMLKRFPNGF